MSAPDTDIKKQEKDHKGPLIGMAFGVAFAGVLLIGFLVWLSANGETPEGAAVQIDGRTGEPVATE